MGWQELHIQSNIPLIVLTISLICIAIIGFLEFKKLSHRINELSLEVHQIKSKGGNKQLEDEEVEKKEDEEVEKKEEMINMMEKMMPNEDTAEIIMGMPPPNMMPGGIASMIIGGPPMMPMGEIHMQNMFEEGMNASPPLDIEEEGNPNQFEEVIDEIKSENKESNEIDEGVKIDEDIEDELSEEEEDEFSEEESESDISGSEISDSEESEEEGDTSIELIQGKGKVEEIKDVNRSLSIKELKEICQNMGLSVSGNKETLIKRINSKK